MDRLSKGNPVPCEKIDKSLFAVCTMISLGNSMMSRFWTDKWLQGSAPHALPLAVSARVISGPAQKGTRCGKGTLFA